MEQELFVNGLFFCDKIYRFYEEHEDVYKKRNDYFSKSDEEVTGNEHLKFHGKQKFVNKIGVLE